MTGGRRNGIVMPVTDAAALLRAYDDQLRDEAEVSGALEWTRIGPVIAATYASGRGFVTYRSLSGPGGTPIDERGVRELVAQVAEHFAARPDRGQVEWKTRGHDHAPGLHDALTAAGFAAEEPESIMIGRADALAAAVALPDGVSLRTVSDEHDVRRMEALQAEVFGRAIPGIVESLLARLARSDGMELWVAEADGEVICTGRLEPVPGTGFAGIWGGATRPQWRGRGVYRALTAARARSALRLGKGLLHSDSTEFSRPILERSGLIKVGTTTPYVWSPAVSPE